jgi:hypothetical protein
MTHLDQLFTHLNRHVAKLRQKYNDFNNGVVQAIIEEEMKIRSEEINAGVRAPNPREQSRES